MSFDIVDPELQRKMKLMALSSHSGWALFEEELKLDLEAHEAKIKQLTQEPLDSHRSDLCELNLAICNRKAVIAILNRVAELKEELGNSPDEA